ncbi:YigZ family protein [Sulfurimonas sp. HSL-1716]|uniref:YigZ family protein n=1 Tax=Hydrocurvibacter sulfurireducens TaxID=3131937 RepID=UPI0031F835CB
MFTIQKESTATYEEKQSKFIAHLVPYTAYKTTLETLKREHPKARHFVTSYRYLNEFDQIVENSSDDGEPKGTSGKPTLSVLQGKELVNTAVIVVRYFGGTKLGTGGLVRAYSDAVNMAINAAELLEYKKEETVSITFAYTDIGRVEYECLQCGVDIVNKSFESDVVFEIKAESSALKDLFAKLDRTIVIA